MKTKGFTLVEALVAIFLVSLAITAFMASSSRGIRASRDSLNETTAQMLAQEELELVRNIRDSNFLTNNLNGWLDGLVGCDQGCIIEPAPLMVATACTDISTVGGCSQLYLSLNNYYTYTGNLTNISKFRRIVNISETPAGATVISRVAWGEGAQTRQVVVTGFLTNWYTQTIPQ